MGRTATRARGEGGLPEPRGQRFAPSRDPSAATQDARSSDFDGPRKSHGKYNLPKDPARARYWLEKVVDGECEHKHLNERAVLADATEMFLALDW